jgi:hypothetical protein
MFLCISIAYFSGLLIFLGVVLHLVYAKMDVMPSRALGDYVVSLWDIRVMKARRRSGKRAMPSVRGLHICASGRCGFTS